jgi:hypothetical protein
MTTWKPDVCHVWVEPRVAASWRVGQALSRWNDARVPGMPRFVRVASRSRADVEVTTRAYLHDTVLGGWATSDGRKGQVIVAWKTAVVWRPRIMLHEFGHILGLAHRATGSTVMRPRADGMAHFPTSSDKDRLRRMY